MENEMLADYLQRDAERTSGLEDADEDWNDWVRNNQMAQGQANIRQNFYNAGVVRPSFVPS